MSAPQNKPSWQGLALGAVGLVTLGLLGAILFGGEPDPPPAPSSPQIIARPRMAQNRLSTDDQRPALGVADVVPGAPPSRDRGTAVTPLALQLRNNAGLQQRLAQMRVQPGLAQQLETQAAPVEPPPTPPGKPGTLSKETIQAVIKEIVPAAKRCYESALKMKPDSQGVVKVGFTVAAVDGGAGITEGEVLESDLQNPVADACLLDAFASARFPVPEGGGSVRVIYPIRLDHGGSAP